LVGVKLNWEVLTPLFAAMSRKTANQEVNW
jgi:hypothetical protein